MSGLLRVTPRPFATVTDTPRKRLDGRMGTYHRAAEPVAKLAHAGQLVTEPTVVVAGRAPAAVYDLIREGQRDALQSAEDVRAALRGYRFRAGFRSVGLKSRSVTFGALPRIAFRQDWCRLSGLASEAPEVHHALASFAPHAAAALVHHLPAPAVHQGQVVRDQVLPEWRLPGVRGCQPFTSGIANDTAPLHYHRDGGNFPGAWSVMLVLRDEGVTGGELVIPELGVALACADLSLVLFNGSQWWHGVTPIRRPRGKHRFSIVYYALQQLRACLCTADEQERAKVSMTTRARRAAARARGEAP